MAIRRLAGNGRAGLVESLERRQLFSAVMSPFAQSIVLDGGPSGGGYTIAEPGEVYFDDEPVGSKDGDSDGSVIQAGFQIEIRFPDNTLTPSQQAIFTTAAALWQTVLLGDIPTATGDFDEDPNVVSSETVDDVRIDATAPFIDGVGMVLGSAGPRFYRSSSKLPITGRMRFDSADIANLEANGRLFSVILHEMGHVLGVGTLWPSGFKNLITGAGTSDPRYTGAAGNAQYQAISGQPAGTMAPIENTGGSGTADAHWRETTFSNELMTGFVSGSNNPLSRMTIGQFADEGYPSVNLNAFDVYSPPGGSNPYPTIGSLTTNADPVATNSTLVLTANNAADNTSVSSVQFYRETNGIAGLQVLFAANGDIAGDLLVGTDNTPADGFSAAVSTSGLSNGAYTYYAQATDSQNLVSVNVSTTNTVGTPVVPSWLAPGSVAAWNVNTKALTVTGAATITADPGVDAPIITANGAAAVLTISSPAGAKVTVGGLTLANGASTIVSATGAIRTLVVNNAFSITGTSKLNLTDNAMVLKNTSLANATNLITSGYGNGSWNGVGINSTTAANDLNGFTTIGFASNADQQATVFAGVTGLDNNDILIRYTYYGDADLNGIVDLDDFNVFLTAFLDPGSYPKTWAYGDFDYNGTIDLDDFNVFLTIFLAGPSPIV